jgi:sporulation protein YlmC with PRC-barrel domain
MDPAEGGDVMRLSDLRNGKVKTLDGEILGRIHEVRCDHGRIVALMCGAPSFIERLTSRAHGRRIAWEEVVRVEKGVVVIAPGKPSAARSRRGTRQPTAPRSKR